MVFPTDAPMLFKLAAAASPTILRFVRAVCARNCAVSFLERRFAYTHYPALDPANGRTILVLKHLHKLSDEQTK